MLSGHVEGQLLKMLVHATRARRVLEIGMFTGYSALAMAEALPDDGSGGGLRDRPGCRGLRTASASPSLPPVAGSTSGRTGAGDPATVWPTTASRFDLVFIDADKAGYAGYLSTVLERDLLADHGLVLRRQHPACRASPGPRSAPTDNGAAIADFNGTVAADDPRRAGARSRSATASP